MGMGIPSAQSKTPRIANLRSLEGELVISHPAAHETRARALRCQGWKHALHSVRSKKAQVR
jgi:hypothetical protein